MGGQGIGTEPGCALSSTGNDFLGNIISSTARRRVAVLLIHTVNVLAIRDCRKNPQDVLFSNPKYLKTLSFQI